MRRHKTAPASAGRARDVTRARRSRARERYVTRPRRLLPVLGQRRLAAGLVCCCWGTRRRPAYLLTRRGVKAQLEERENKKYATFKAVEFRSQVVAGRNYFIKVQVDDDEFVHLRVFQSLPHENKPLALSSYQTNKARHDELAYF
ncbi:cystatin-B [Ailuropoda melanoleuca]|uniref:cystatin-B n=1 Tax=Ailuropoda melanoleuca TaxID=9646 RepID=UPI00149456B8|nr:cystatin-B [Ailuropoda melanoleuca]